MNPTSGVPAKLLITVPALIWATGNGILGILVAPAAFGVAPPRGDLITREAAGALFGLLLERWTHLPVALLLIPILFGLGLLIGRAWQQRRQVLAGLLLATLCVTWGAHAVARQTIQEVQVLAEQRRSESARTPAGEAAFAERHHASETWVKLETLAALLLAVGGIVGLVRERQPSAPAVPA